MGVNNKKYSLFEYMYVQGQMDALQRQNREIQEEIIGYESNFEENKDDAMAQAIDMLELEELKDKLRINGNNIKRLREACSHELVLYLGKEYIKDEDQGLAICLECEQKLYLKTLDKDLEIDPDAIINVAGIIPEDYICAYNGNRNILASRAKEKLFYMSESNPTMSLEEVKQNILEDLVYYTDELTYRKVNPRKRARKISERK